jgi:hypothetical protein
MCVKQILIVERGKNVDQSMLEIFFQKMITKKMKII